MIPVPLQILSDFHLLLFLGFFGAAAIAIRYHDRRGVRAGFLAFFVVLLVVQGTVVPPGWPFNGWTLFGNEAPTEDVRYEFRVVDADGNELRYDPRATSVLISPVSHRYGQKIDDEYWGESYTDQEASELAQYLLYRATKYRTTVESGTYDGTYKFPRHQLDYRWNEQRLQEIGAFETLRLYRIAIHVSHDGNEVAMSEAVAWEYEASYGEARGANA